MPPPTTSCPVCAAAIPASLLTAHVNRCLDPPSPPSDLEIPSPPSSSSSSSSSAPPYAPPYAPPSPPPHPQKPLAPWLSSLALSKYTPGLLRSGYRSLHDLLQARPTIHSSLRAAGVAALGARKKIASELARLSPPHEKLPPAVAPPPPPDAPAPKNPRHPPAKRKVWAIFEPGYRAIDTPSPTKRPRSGVTAAARPASAPAKRKPIRKHWFSHRVPATSFTVDSFYAAPADPASSKYFLTHFHSDHYGGLRKSTLPEGSLVFCSKVTAALVHSQLRVRQESVVELPLGVKVDVEEPHGDGGVSVWAYDANHCPGAVVLLFYVWKTRRFVLHSGDCRFDPAVFGQHAKIVEVIKEGKLDYLHLDTTYCNPQYVFPHQRSILEQVVHAAKDENRRTKGQCLFFFGTYSIGKEKVFFAVAEALNLKVYAGKRKRGILEQCDFGSKLTARLVNNAGEARVQVVSMRALSADGLREYAARNKLNASFIGRGLAIVFRPTGWTFRGDPSKPRRVNRSADQAMLYEVAYSEHSSYEELVAFVKWSQPARLLPTVNARSKEDADKLRTLLGHSDKPLRQVSSPEVSAGA